ncbi:hypothetical protein PV08_02244 [Exophiala spinifera]|uniref:Transcription factor domain-containing protein n=1 Tax=Exophiala spinifera TaxID=91928 RepID=A0A0D2CDP2_9EURO|nr:uncharacterized protein PV08_02244 [Exophiala spinifera]KIW21664.1 hypothetical protein PV08_02244 [Exophiala spinifera]
MAKAQYSAGLHFIVRTSDQAPNKEDRRAVMSHAAKRRWKSRKTPKLHSWIDPERSLGDVEKHEESLAPSVLPMLGLNHFGGDLNGTPLPSGIEPAMVQDLVKLIELDKNGVYPYEVCLRVHPVQRGWFAYMISDICCIHSMMFSVRAFVDNISSLEQISKAAAFHYDQTLRHLQARINVFEHTAWDPALSDCTIMVILNLAQAAEITGDLEAARNHVNGLLRIVSLRGGLRSLHAHNNLQVKVCRADLGLAMRFGTLPRLFQDDIEWSCFIADRGLIRCQHGDFETQVRTFIDGLDSRLRDCWKDAHAFSCLSNLTYQTTRKLSPGTYCEMMISILYRLMHLSMKQDTLQEAVRLGLQAFCTTLFMTRHYLDKPYEQLVEKFRTALYGVFHVSAIVVPDLIMLWFMMLYRIVAYKEPLASDWESVQLEQAVLLTGVTTWPHAHSMLKSVMWVGFVHDSPGVRVFEAARIRLEKPKEIDGQKNEDRRHSGANTELG